MGCAFLRIYDCLGWDKCNKRRRRRRRRRRVVSCRETTTHFCKQGSAFVHVVGSMHMLVDWVYNLHTVLL